MKKDNSKRISRRKFVQLAGVSGAGVLLAACGGKAPQLSAILLPTASSTPVPTNTPAPTSTPLPTSTNTPAPTNTPVPTSTSLPGVTLPHNLTTNAGTLFEDFESAADWTAVNGTVANNTTAGQFRTGTQSVKMTASTGLAATFTKTVAWNWSAGGIMECWWYFHDPAANYTNLTIRVSSDSAMSNRYNFIYQPTQIYPAETPGWCKLTLNLNDVAQSGSPNSAALIRIRCSISAAASVTASVSFDSLYFGAQTVAALCLEHDDSRSSYYINAWPVLKANLIPVTIFVITGYVGMTGYMTWTQLHDMVNGGCIIGNHTQNHPDLSTMTEAQQETEIQAAITDLTNNGFGATARYMSFPFGGWNSDTMTACANLGILTSRTTDPQWVYRPDVMPLYNNLQMDCNGISAVATATIESYIDRCVNGKYLFSLYSHGVEDAENNTPLANFTPIVQYIAAKRDAGLLYPIRITDFYNLTIGSSVIKKYL